MFRVNFIFTSQLSLLILLVCLRVKRRIEIKMLTLDYWYAIQLKLINSHVLEYLNISFLLSTSVKSCMMSIFIPGPSKMWKLAITRRVFSSFQRSEKTISYNQEKVSSLMPIPHRIGNRPIIQGHISLTNWDQAYLAIQNQKMITRIYLMRYSVI